MSPQCFDQSLFPEFLFCTVIRFSYAIGVECERVPWVKLAFPNRAIPLFEDSQDRGCGIEPFQSVIAPEEKSGEMPAIRVAQAAHAVVIFGEEKCGEGAVRRILTKQPVHRAQEALRLIERDGALAAEIRLQIGHQESGGDSFSRDVADHQTEPLLA